MDLTLGDDDDDDTPAIIGVRSATAQPTNIKQPPKKPQPRPPKKQSPPKKTQSRPPKKKSPPKKTQSLPPEKQPSKQPTKNQVVSTDYTALRVIDLRIALVSRSLSVLGNKATMVARLRAYDQRQANRSKNQAGGSKSKSGIAPTGEKKATKK